MSKKIIKDIFSFAFFENANFLAINSDENKIKFNFFLPFNKQKTLSLPQRYERNFFKTLLQTLKLQEGELILKKETVYKIDNKREIKLLSSIIPENNNERIIIQFNKKRPQKMRLSQLGFTRKDLNILKQSIENKSGLILLSGDRQSGTSTTLLSCLSYLNSDNKNIVMLGKNTDLCAKGILVLEQKSENIKNLNRHQADIIGIDSITSNTMLGEAFKLASQGNLVISCLNTNSKDDIAKMIKLAPWPKVEKINILKLISYQKLKKIENNFSLKETLENKRHKNNREKIGRFEIIYSKS